MTTIRCLHSCMYLFGIHNKDYSGYFIVRDVTDFEMEDAIKYTCTRRPLIRLLSLVKHQPFSREICGIVEVPYSNARLGIYPMRVHGPLRPRIFSCKCGYLFFCTSNAEQWRSNSFPPESRIEIVGINAKASLRSREYKHFLNGSDEGRWFLLYRGFRCNFIG